MSKQSKPSIVFAHGIWADGSCFQKLIPTLRAEGHEVMAAQYGLDTLKGDVEATLRTFGRVGNRHPGHGVTGAGVDDCQFQGLHGARVPTQIRSTLPISHVTETWRAGC